MGFVSKAHIREDFWNNCLFCIRSPEGRFDTQFYHTLYKDADIMTQNLAENFINLSNWSLSPNRSPEFHLNHTEGRLNIRPLMVVSQESLLVVVVEVPHLSPEAVKLLTSLSALGIALERNVG